MALSHAKSGEVINLGTIVDDKSVALVKTEQFETICVHLPAGKVMPDHKVGGPIIVQCLSGKCLFSVEGNPKELRSGLWLYLEGGVVHAAEAQEETVLLVTIFFQKNE